MCLFPVLYICKFHYTDPLCMFLDAQRPSLDHRLIAGRKLESQYSSLGQCLHYTVQISPSSLTLIFTV